MYCQPPEVNPLTGSSFDSAIKTWKGLSSDIGRAIPLRSKCDCNCILYPKGPMWSNVADILLCAKANFPAAGNNVTHVSPFSR
jgi:hypothetical protein